MTTPIDRTESPFGDGRIAEAIVNPDRSWVALDKNGMPLAFVDPDDYEVVEALVRYPYEREPVR